MSEEDLAQAQGAVYSFENESWQPVAAGLSMIGLYFNPETGLYRIVGIDIDSSEVTLNAALVADTEYQQASERFHQFSDHEGKVCGINFADEEASTFAAAVTKALKSLKDAIESQRVAEENARKKREAEEKEKARRQKEEADKERVRKQKEDEARRRAEEEARQRDEEARRQKEEDEKARKEFEEQKKREAKVEEEKKKKREEEDRKRRQEEQKRKEEERLRAEEEARQKEEERARAGSRPAKRGLPQLDPQALQKAAIEGAKDPNKPATPRATLDQRYRHRVANMKTKIALIRGLIQIKDVNGDNFIVHIIDDADTTKKSEPQPVLMQLRDEVKKLSGLLQAKNAQEKRYFSQFGEPQKDKDLMLDSEVETLLSGLDYVEDAANRLEEQRNSAQNQHSNSMQDEEAAAYERELAERAEQERQQLEELARKRDEELARKREEEKRRVEEAMRAADERRAAAAAAYKPAAAKAAPAPSHAPVSITSSPASPTNGKSSRQAEGSASTGASSTAELESFKKDLIASMRREVQSFKDALIQDIRFDM